MFTGGKEADWWYEMGKDAVKTLKDYIKRHDFLRLSFCVSFLANKSSFQNRIRKTVKYLRWRFLPK